ncbi:hypothetical protein BGW42_003704 [Actinomortierella wolfii]|nr:hypothetical protein BGW42_003704 [Actinomortierella wolfii]KAG0242889.1 hypothetical protein BGW41_003289 [Actinomortierella wolfii]
MLPAVVSRVAIATAAKPVQVSYIARRAYSSKFDEREKAQEEMYIREKEKEQIKKLQEKLAELEKRLEQVQNKDKK